MISTLILSTTLAAGPRGEATAWRSELRKEIPLLGHRNWIVVADSAYPAQNSPGVRTIVTHSSQTLVLKAVMNDLARAKHVTPIIRLDKELAFVQEEDAPGVSAYRRELQSILSGRNVKTELHEDLIRDLDEAGKTFRILLLKTDFTVPYTTVFMQLDCAYWGPAKEGKLRKAMENGNRP